MLFFAFIMALVASLLLSVHATPVLALQGEVAPLHSAFAHLETSVLSSSYPWRPALPSSLCNDDLVLAIKVLGRQITSLTSPVLALSSSQPSQRDEHIRAIVHSSFNGTVTIIALVLLIAHLAPRRVIANHDESALQVSPLFDFSQVTAEEDAQAIIAQQIAAALTAKTARPVTTIEPLAPPATLTEPAKSKLEPIVERPKVRWLLLVRQTPILTCAQLTSRPKISTSPSSSAPAAISSMPMTPVTSKRQPKRHVYLGPGYSVRDCLARSNPKIIVDEAPIAVKAANKVLSEADVAPKAIEEAFTPVVVKAATVIVTPVPDDHSALSFIARSCSPKHKTSKLRIYEVRCCSY